MSAELTRGRTNLAVVDDTATAKRRQGGPPEPAVVDDTATAKRRQGGPHEPAVVEGAARFLAAVRSLVVPFPAPTGNQSVLIGPR